MYLSFFENLSYFVSSSQALVGQVKKVASVVCNNGLFSFCSYLVVSSH